jgi:predicted extracellular nuclease
VRPILPALLALLAVGGCAGAPPRGDALRVATWNVENLFDEEPPGERRTAGEVAEKLERLGAALRALDADVVALQEVENDAVLARLAEGPLRARGYRRCLVDGPDEREVAVLARVPVTGCAARAEPRTLFSRPPLEVHLDAGGRRVVALVVHLKSKVGVNTHLLRARQASRVRAIADEVRASHPDALVLVAGDLNDLPESDPLAPLLADGAWVDVGAGLPLDAGWTYLYRGRRERIDYLLVPRDAPIDATPLAAPNAPPEASDHRPVVADVVWR